jgi:hypothetical protein
MKIIIVEINNAMSLRIRFHDILEVLVSVVKHPQSISIPLAMFVMIAIIKTRRRLEITNELARIKIPKIKKIPEINSSQGNKIENIGTK